MMPGVIKATAARRQTQDHPIQPAVHCAVSQRTSEKTNAVERNIGTPDIRNLLKSQNLGSETALPRNGSQVLMSTSNLGILTTSDWDYPHEDEICQVRIPKVEKQQCIRKAHWNSEEESYAFGWETYRTRATKNEVCNKFLHHSCRWGIDCHRIHPRHKPRPPKVQVLTGTAQNQECIASHIATRTLEDHILEVPLLQGRRREEDSFQAEVVPEFVVKLPEKGRNVAPLESTIFQRPIGRSSTVLTREGSGEVTPKVHSRDLSDRRSSFDRSLRDTSSGVTDFSLPSENRVLDVETENSSYSDLHWDPQTGFWGYHINERAWTGTAETSDGNISDSSVRRYAKFIVIAQLRAI